MSETLPDNIYSINRGNPLKNIENWDEKKCLKHKVFKILKLWGKFTLLSGKLECFLSKTSSIDKYLKGRPASPIG